MQDSPGLFAAIVLTIEDDEVRERAVLRYIMFQRGISMQDVATELGISRRYVHYLLTGKRKNQQALDNVDKAVTKLTEDRGGIDALCSSNKHNHWILGEPDA